MPGKEDLDAVRLDKWLYAVRIFKTRTAAAKAIAGGKIKLNGEGAKAHKQVKRGDEVETRRDGRTFSYKVLGLFDKRVGAKDAQPCYEVTEDADLNPDMREMVQLYRQIDKQNEPERGRPTKRDRRMINQMKGRE